MEPVYITEEDVWEGAEALTIGPPPGSEFSVRPVMAITDLVSLVEEDSVHQAPRWSMKIKLEPEEVTALQDDPHLWVSILAYRLPPFQIGLLPEGVERF